MKLITLTWGCVVGAVLAGFALGASVQAGTKTETNKPSRAYVDVSKPVQKRIILVDVTGSRIPQRIVLYGYQATSASPLYVIQNEELLNTGATSVAGLLKLDPSVQVTRAHP